jgi:hypothetical protein
MATKQIRDLTQENSPAAADKLEIQKGSNNASRFSTVEQVVQSVPPRTHGNDEHSVAFAEEDFVIANFGRVTIYEYGLPTAEEGLLAYDEGTGDLVYGYDSVWMNMIPGASSGQAGQLLMTNGDGTGNSWTSNISWSDSAGLIVFRDTHPAFTVRRLGNSSSGDVAAAVVERLSETALASGDGVQFQFQLNRVGEATFAAATLVGRMATSTTGRLAVRTNNAGSSADRLTVDHTSTTSNVPLISGDYTLDNSISGSGGFLRFKNAGDFKWRWAVVTTAGTTLNAMACVMLNDDGSFNNNAFVMRHSPGTQIEFRRPLIVSSGSGIEEIDASARFQVNSTTRGVRFCCGTTTQRNAISSPVEGLEFYDLTLHKKCFWNGSAWRTLDDTAA